MAALYIYALKSCATPDVDATPDAEPDVDATPDAEPDVDATPVELVEPLANDNY
jgi:hypothetical protein